MFWRKFLEGILNISIVIGVIISLVMAGIAMEEGFFAAVIVFAISMLVTLISCSALGLITEVAENLENMDKNLQEIKSIQYALRENSIQQPNRDTYNNSVVNSAPVAEQSVRYNASTRQYTTNSDNTWTCTSCSTKNQKSASFCKSCGEYKF